MKKSPSKLYAIVVIISFFIMYSLLLFALKHDFSISHWIAYGYTVLALLVFVINMITNKGHAKSYPMFGIYLSSAASAYFAAQFIIGGIIAMCIPVLDSTFVSIFGLVLFLIYLLIAYMFFRTNDNAEIQDDLAYDKVAAMRMLKADLDAITADIRDEEIRNDLRALAEKVRYSDPMSDDSLSELEARIRNNVSILREAVDDDHEERIRSCLAKLNKLLIERNAMCITLKK